MKSDFEYVYYNSAVFCCLCNFFPKVKQSILDDEDFMNNLIKKFKAYTNAVILEDIHIVEECHKDFVTYLSNKFPEQMKSVMETV